jgi:hypothetical protein
MTSEARFVINIAVAIIGVGLFVSSCLLAWIKGGKAERWGASLYVFSALGTLGFEMVTGQATPVLEELLLDTAVAVGFLVLAIRYNNLWLGAAMMVKGLQLAVHATHLTDGEDPMFLGFNLYAASLNLISLVICLILGGGTLASMRQRAKRRAAEAQAKTPRPDPRDLSRRSPLAAAQR